MQFERCAADPVDEMERTCRFLGVQAPDEPPERLLLHKQAGRKTPELADPVAEELAERYREDSHRLAELCPEIDLSLWPSVSSPSRRGRGTAAPVGAG
jgi:hypothetical protein